MSSRSPNKAILFLVLNVGQRLDQQINANYFGNCIVTKLVVHETKALREDDGFISALEAVINELNGMENWMSMMQSKTSRIGCV
jgi:hypothetical protein